MSVTLNPHFSFRDTAEEATTFHRSVFGGDLTVGENVSVAVSGDGEAVLRTRWEKLQDGATVTVPLDGAPWGGLFGMCTDRFGIHRMVSTDVGES